MFGVSLPSETLKIWSWGLLNLSGMHFKVHTLSSNHGLELVLSVGFLFFSCSFFLLVSSVFSYEIGYKLWNCYITLHPLISEFYSTWLKSEVRRSPETLLRNSILLLCTMLLTWPMVVHPVFGGDVIKLLNLLRSEIDKTSPLLLLSFDFSTLYSSINLMDLRACMKESVEVDV